MTSRLLLDPRQRFVIGKDKDGNDIEKSASDLVWKDRSLDLSPGEKSAYWKLCSFGQKSGEVFIRDETLAAEIGINGRHFRSHKTRLKEVGLIDWSRAEHKRCSRYVFLMHPILTGNGCAGQLSGSTSATGNTNATGNRCAAATGSTSAAVTGNRSAVVKNLRNLSEAHANQSVPTSSARVRASFPKLPILDQTAFPSEFRDPSVVNAAGIVDPTYFVGYMEPLAADIIDFEDPLTRLSLCRRNTRNCFDYPGDVTFNEDSFNDDLRYLANAAREGEFPSLHAGLRAVIEGEYPVSSSIWEEIAAQARDRGIVATGAPVIRSWFDEEVYDEMFATA